MWPACWMAHRRTCVVRVLPARVRSPFRWLLRMSLLFRHVTILSAGASCLSRARFLALQSQFSHLGLQFVGIQEGRMRTSALRVCSGYFCLVGPGNANGCFGCELCVSTLIPWNGNNTGTEKFFKPSDFQVMFATERMHGVAARWGDYALHLVVGHAPCWALCWEPQWRES